jgi:glycosyltransferase involved in cell wall biosynthesis
MLMAPADFSNAVYFYPQDFSSAKIYPYLLFPDRLVGWDYVNKKYLLKPIRKNEILFERSQLPVLSHSHFTLALTRVTYSQIRHARVTYLPIDFETIRSISKAKKPWLKVLWNHMWRSDKGVVEAFNTINKLSDRYPDVEFHIGQNEQWGIHPDKEKIKDAVRPTLNQLRKKENVFFIAKIKRQRDYFAFLRQFDIGFSCSYHEGFGLSMLEQAAAGIACIVPNRECYPEIFQGALSAVPYRIGQYISALIENRQFRETVSESCQESASKYDVGQWVSCMLSLFEKY